MPPAALASEPSATQPTDGQSEAQAQADDDAKTEPKPEPKPELEAEAKPKAAEDPARNKDSHKDKRSTDKSGKRPSREKEQEKKQEKQREKSEKKADEAADAAPWWNRDAKLTPEQVAPALEVIEQIDPDVAKRMRKLHEDKPEKARVALHREFPRVRYLLSLRERDPEMYELRIDDIRLADEARTLADKLEKARDKDDDERIEKLTAELREAVSAHFDVRQKVRQRELQWLEKRVERMQRKLASKADDREALIDQRMEELASDGDTTEW